MTAIRVLIVEDQTLVREGLESLLALTSDISVVGLAADGDEGLAMLRTSSPDVVLLDVRMPRTTGIEFLQALRDRGNPTPAILLTTFDDGRRSAQWYPAWREGVLDEGCLTRHAHRGDPPGGERRHPDQSGRDRRITAPMEGSAASGVAGRHRRREPLDAARNRNPALDDRWLHQPRNRSRPRSLRRHGQESCVEHPVKTSLPRSHARGPEGHRARIRLARS